MLLKYYSDLGTSFCHTIYYLCKNKHLQSNGLSFKYHWISLYLMMCSWCSSIWFSPWSWWRMGWNQPKQWKLKYPAKYLSLKYHCLLQLSLPSVNWWYPDKVWWQMCVGHQTQRITRQRWCHISKESPWLRIVSVQSKTVLSFHLLNWNVSWMTTSKIDFKDFRYQRDIRDSRVSFLTNFDGMSLHFTILRRRENGIQCNLTDNVNIKDTL